MRKRVIILTCMPQLGVTKIDQYDNENNTHEEADDDHKFRIDTEKDV